ncbi:MAG: MTH1187 family thiamine-binding protein [Archaeoglobales archaeon]|nr:MTH1187 family thiamine-binding protein [Archaeoglobales archaeon]
MIVELSAVPLGYTSLSKFVAEVLKLIEQCGIKYSLNPMGTVVEVKSFQELSEILEKIDKKLKELGSTRNYYVLKIDTKEVEMEKKVKSVVEKMS